LGDRLVFKVSSYSPELDLVEREQEQEQANEGGVTVLAS
jgi:hypothetical protein